MSELTGARICQVVDKIYALHPTLTTKPNRVLNVALRLTAQHFATASLDSNDYTRRTVFFRVFARASTDICEEFARSDLKTLLRNAVPAGLDKRDILAYMLDAAYPADTADYYAECAQILSQTLSNILTNHKNSNAATLQAIVPDITILLTALCFVAQIADICGETTHYKMTLSAGNTKEILMSSIPSPHYDNFSVLFGQLLNRNAIAYVPSPDHEHGLFGPAYVWYLEALAEGKLSDKQDEYIIALKRISDTLKLTFQLDKDMNAVAFESFSSREGKAAYDRYYRTSQKIPLRSPWTTYHYNSLNKTMLNSAKSVEDFFLTCPLMVKWLINAFLSALKFTTSAAASTDVWPHVTYVPPPPVVYNQRVARKKRLIYAVAIGRNPGIYETWEEANEMVYRYPGNRHRSFPATRQGYYDAECYIQDIQEEQGYYSENGSEEEEDQYGYW